MDLFVHSSKIASKSQQILYFIKQNWSIEFILENICFNHHFLKNSKWFPRLYPLCAFIVVTYLRDMLIYYKMRLRCYNIRNNGAYIVKYREDSLFKVQYNFCILQFGVIHKPRRLKTKKGRHCLKETEVPKIVYISKSV